MEQEIKQAALRHVESVAGNNACYDSFVAGVNWLLEKDIKDDFLRPKDIFEVDDEFYICTAIVHANKRIWGIPVSMLDIKPKQVDFTFEQVSNRYFKK